MRRGCSACAAPERVRARGFTLVELLVVLAVIGILAALLLPAVNRARHSAWTAQCVGNMKGLQMAWHFYTEDGNDRFPPNAPSHWAGFPGGEPAWVAGWMAYTKAGDGLSTHATNAALLTMPGEGHIGPLVGSPKPFKCPADRKLAMVGGILQRRVRSCSLNQSLNSSVAGWMPDGSPGNFVGLRQMNELNPTEVFAFVDEQEDSLDFVPFQWPTLIPSRPGNWGPGDIPGHRHRGGATLSFCDGHVEVKRWKDPRTSPPVTGEWVRGGPDQRNNVDFLWLRMHGFLWRPGWH